MHLQGVDTFIYSFHQKLRRLKFDPSKENRNTGQLHFNLQKLLIMHLQQFFVIHTDILIVDSHVLLKEKS